MKAINQSIWLLIILGVSLQSSSRLFMRLNQNFTSMAPAGSPVATHGQLRTSGNKIVDQSGNPVILRGASLFWSQWAGKWWTPESVAWLTSDWNCSVVRAAMGVTQGGYQSTPAQSIQMVETVVAAAMQQGIYVIIDWHIGPEQPQIGLARPFWDMMSRKYANHPAVLFETYNEPGPDWGSIKSYHEQIVPIIRANAKNLIILGTPNWSQDVDTAANDRVSGENLAYTLHFYSSVHKQSLRDKADRAMSQGLALFITEWGPCDNNSPNDYEEANRWLNWANDHGISTAAWGVYDKNETCAGLTPGAPSAGWTDSQLTTDGQYLKNWIKTGKPGSGPHPHPTPSGDGCCSWDGGNSCGPTTPYCESNAAACGNCKGQWKPNTPPPPPHGNGCCSWDGGNSCGDTTPYCNSGAQECQGDCRGQWKSW